MVLFVFVVPCVDLALTESLVGCGFQKWPAKWTACSPRASSRETSQAYTHFYPPEQSCGSYCSWHDTVCVNSTLPAHGIAVHCRKLCS